MVVQTNDVLLSQSKDGSAGQTPSSAVKLNTAKQASWMMLLINGNIGTN